VISSAFGGDLLAFVLVIPPRSPSGLCSFHFRLLVFLGSSCPCPLYLMSVPHFNSRWLSAGFCSGYSSLAVVISSASLGAICLFPLTFCLVVSCRRTLCPLRRAVLFSSSSFFFLPPIPHECLSFQLKVAICWLLFWLFLLGWV
jgi:hypothetical protein